MKNINYKEDPLYNKKLTNSPYYDETEFIWETGEYCKNCKDCKDRDGEIKTYKGWEEIGMPFSKILACSLNDMCDLNFLHFIGHPKRGKLPIKNGEENGNKKTTTIYQGL